MSTMAPLQEAAKAIGVTYRQADYWNRNGYIRATYFDHLGREVPDSGYMIGHHAFLSAVEVSVLGVMARLVAAGLRHDTAADVARTLIEKPDAPHVPLGHGVRLVIDPAPAQTEQVAS